MDKLEESSKVDKRQRHIRNMARSGRCTLCPPHDGENRRRWKRRSNGRRKDK